MACSRVNFTFAFYGAQWRRGLPLSVFLSLVFMCLVEFTVWGSAHRKVSLPGQFNTNREKEYENTSEHQCRQDCWQSGAEWLYVKRPDLLMNNCREAERTIIFIYRLQIRMSSLDQTCRDCMQFSGVFVEFVLFELIIIKYKKVNYLKIPRLCKCTTLHRAAGAHASVLQQQFEPMTSVREVLWGPTPRLLLSIKDITLDTAHKKTESPSMIAGQAEMHILCNIRVTFATSWYVWAIAVLPYRHASHTRRQAVSYKQAQVLRQHFTVE